MEDKDQVSRRVRTDSPKDKLTVLELTIKNLRAENDMLKQEINELHKEITDIYNRLQGA